jgi:rhodanese-related sulfurtransferase
VARSWRPGKLFQRFDDTVFLGDGEPDFAAGCGIGYGCGVEGPGRTMTNRWRCHGIALLVTWTLGLAACGSGDDGPDAADSCGCGDFQTTDIPMSTDAPAVDTQPPADVSPIDAPGEDTPAPDVPGVDAPQPDLTTPDILPEDLPLPDDPGLPPATLGLVSPADLTAELAHKDFLLINVHVPDAGQVPGTDIHLTYANVDAIAAYMGTNLAVKTVVYCLSNYMSKIAGDDLVLRGYRNVRYLDGGMSGWRNAGYIIEPTPP